MGDKRHFGGKTLHMVGFLYEIAVRNEHGEVRVDVSRCLKPLVQLVLYVFPYVIAVGTNDHGALYGAVVRHLRL